MKDISFFNKHGLAVIPVKPKSKMPAIAGWPKRCVDDNDASEFNDDSNVGAVLGKGSNGIVDIDLDAQAAINLAPFFLPETGWIFGRETAPKSHWLYRIKGELGGKKAIMLDGETFAEYRADGCMTVFPDSIHGETGEAIQWSTCEEPAVASREELVDALKKMAITAAVLPNYKEGSRNDIVNALAGTLLFYGVTIVDIKHIVGVLCDVTADEEIDSRRNCVDTTAARKSANKPVTGEQQLRELIGEGSVTSIISYLGGRKNSVPAVNGTSPSSSNNVFSDDEMNDMGVAKRFAKRKRGEVVHIDELGSFFTYNGQIWEQDSGVRVANIFDSFVTETLDALRIDKTIQHSELTRQSRFHLNYRNRRQRENAISSSKSAMLMSMTKLDANRDLIAVENGVLNLRTGKLLDFDPSHYITRKLAPFIHEAVAV